MPIWAYTPGMEPLTERQQRLLHFIEGQLQAHHPPSQLEMAEHFGLARNAIRQGLAYLVRKGYILNGGGHRAIRLSQGYLAQKKVGQGIPILGRVAAGQPILAQEHIEGYVDLGLWLGASQEAFVLKVTGDSMVDDGIMDGDYVLVEPSRPLESGQIGVVLLDDEATVKRVFLQRNRIALRPANRTAGYQTRYVKRNGPTVRLVGPVTGCIRKVR